MYDSEFDDKRSADFESALIFINQDQGQELKSFLLNHPHLKAEHNVSVYIDKREYRGGDEVRITKTTVKKNLLWFAVKNNKPECIKVLIEFIGSMEDCEDRNIDEQEVSYGFTGSSHDYSSQEHKNVAEVAEGENSTQAVKQILFDHICEKKECSKYREFIKKNFTVLDISKFNLKDFSFFSDVISENERQNLKQSLLTKGVEVSAWIITTEDLYQAVINKNYIPTRDEVNVLYRERALQDEKVREMYQVLKDKPEAKNVLPALLDFSALREEKKKAEIKETEDRLKKLFGSNENKQVEKTKKTRKKRKNENADDEESKRRKSTQGDITHYFKKNTHSSAFFDNPPSSTSSQVATQHQSSVIPAKEKSKTVTMPDCKSTQSQDFAKALLYVHQDKPEELKTFLLNNAHLKSEHQISTLTESREYHGGDEVDTTEMKTEKNLIWFAIHKEKPECLKVLIDFYGTLENCERTVKTVCHSTYFFGGNSREHESKSSKNAMEVANACHTSQAIKQILLNYLSKDETQEKAKDKKTSFTY